MEQGKSSAIYINPLVLRQAIGSMADAVAEEIDELKRDMASDLETHVNLLTNRIQNAQLSADRAENEQVKFKFQIERLQEEIQRRVAAPEVP